MRITKHRKKFTLILSLVSFFFLIGCSEVEKKLNDTQSLNTVCPIIESKSNYLLENPRNISEAQKLISAKSNSSQYRNQILNFSLAQLYLSPHSTNLNSHTLFFAKINGKEIFINSIPDETYEFSFIAALNELAQQLKKPISLKSRLNLVEKNISEYVYASRSLEEFIKNNQAQLFKSKPLKKMYFRGAQGIRENELFRRLDYLKDYNLLKRKASPTKNKTNLTSAHLFTRDNYSCSFDSKVFNADIMILKKPEKAYHNIFSHYKDKNNYIIGVTSSVPKVDNSINEFLFQKSNNDSYTAACMTKDQRNHSIFLFMNGITYNAQVLNRLINSHSQVTNAKDFMDTKRSLMLTNPKRKVSEIYGINRVKDNKEAQYYIPSLGRLTILEQGEFLSTFNDPRNKQLKCN
ncbi:putative lipoprotein [Halobacteriovorax sp. BALOs_7]|uniref:hypothetical protein n=1 Tax=Halobacteriovorax sp. BALOs_7 TaxID=2109558 RepID=UPI000EA0DFBB|nr:hypothetical protein [Halobacteriovorax sp. BALOs_7]AYF44304.1 putative lipoprotein [Halobacteriovorax sp. BALOs_7]